ncbi:LysR family transcriptional regulator [Phytoactinopolyspora limicola]|uniref:LysR family transcriptional regulator n=1 Tax=Phytoactinopolyspora limicola TaxID=2715536 RepID=UPI00140B9A71|nr:LysR family transcriptional regulator [Phytoactinopolyspora limicola]
MRFDLQRMRVLRELHHRGTMAAVAEALSYSTSAVSQQLATLENELGVSLFVRDGRRVRLTREALIIVKHTERILGELEQAEAEISSTYDEVTGTLNVASMQTMTLAVLPTILGRLKQEHPKLTVTVTQAEPDTAIPRLLVGDFDLVINESYPSWPNIQTPGVSVQTFGTDQLRLAIAEPLLPAGGFTGLHDLTATSWGIEPEGTPAHDWVRYACRKAGFVPHVVVTTADMIAQARFVEAGLIVAILPDLLWSCIPCQVELYDLTPPSYRELQTSIRVGSEDNHAVVAFQQALAATWADVTGGAGSLL